MLRHILLSLFLLVCVHTDAQPDFLFSYLGMQHGLAGEYVRQVQQDKNGYMWVMTRSCLQRYDGIRFLDLYTGRGVLPQGFIREILIDKQNRLWVSFENDILGYLDPVTFKWHPVKLILGKGLAVRDPHFFESNDGKIIFACTGKTFLTFSEEKHEFSEGYNLFKLPGGWNFISLWQDKNQNYWVSTYGGLVKYNSSKNTLSYKGHNTDADRYIAMTEDLTMIQNFFIDQNETGWITSWPATTGLSFKSIDIKNGKTRKRELEIYDGLKGEYYTIIKLLQIKGALWMYGDNLLALYDSANSRFLYVPKSAPGKFSISYDVVNHVYEDREHNMWISTNQGLYRYTAANKQLRSFNNYKPGNKETFTVEVTDILETTSGEVWISTWGGNGIYTYDTAFKPVYSKLLKDDYGKNAAMVWSMVQMNNEDIWWGAQDGWLWKYDAAKKHVYSFQPALAAQHTIRQLAKDAQDNLWIGVQGGRIIKFNPATGEWLFVHKAGSSVTRMIVSQKNEVWVATDYDGVYCIEAATGKVMRHYTDSLPQGKKLLSPGAGDFLEYNDSIMLIVSAGLDILNLHTDSIQHNYSQYEIFNLAKDAEGLVWASTNLGLMAFSLRHEKPVLKYDQRDGYSNFSFSIAASGSISNGTIVFGNNHGFLAFNPEMLKREVEKNIAGKVLIAEVYVNESSLRVDSILQLKRLKIGPGDVSVKVRYTTNAFKEPLPVYYMLEGIDKTWKEASGNSEVMMSYLPPGKYLLKAGIMDENNQVGSVTELFVEIAPRFYQTEWFYILILLVALGILFLLDYYRMKRKEDVQQLRRNIARQLHEDVSSTLEKVNILSDIAIIKHETDPVKSREFIAEIKMRSAAMVSAMQDMLWAIAPENDSMKELVKRFHKYVQVTNNRHNVQIDFAADEKVSKLKLNMQVRYELLLLFKRSLKFLMSVAVKEVRIYIGFEKNILYYIFQFVNEAGDTKQLNNFFSSKDLNDRLKKLNGEITTTVKAHITEIIFRINV
ncbi:ligand-binding sensor domain-containing protein [Terrimonas sp.]|uniref:ligand-binding sensor domain-containing protein n=1 Tax=Terrimonas sp. TaxID=1914338 RepID=UPI00105726E0|nr:sensor histidine kinase [Terrimonas sp.]